MKIKYPNFMVLSIVLVMVEIVYILFYLFYRIMFYK